MYILDLISTQPLGNTVIRWVKTPCGCRRRSHIQKNTTAHSHSEAFVHGPPFKEHFKWYFTLVWHFHFPLCSHQCELLPGCSPSAFWPFPSFLYQWLEASKIVYWKRKTDNLRRTSTNKVLLTIIKNPSYILQWELLGLSEVVKVVTQWIKEHERDVSHLPSPQYQNKWQRLNMWCAFHCHPIVRGPTGVATCTNHVRINLLVRFRLYPRFPTRQQFLQRPQIGGKPELPFNQYK